MEGNKFIDTALFLEQLRYTKDVYRARGDNKAVSFLEAMMNAVQNHSSNDLFIDLG